MEDVCSSRLLQGEEAWSTKCSSVGLPAVPSPAARQACARLARDLPPTFLPLVRLYDSLFPSLCVFALKLQLPLHCLFAASYVSSFTRLDTFRVAASAVHDRVTLAPHVRPRSLNLSLACELLAAWQPTVCTRALSPFWRRWLPCLRGQPTSRRNRHTSFSKSSRNPYAVTRVWYQVVADAAQVDAWTTTLAILQSGSEPENKLFAATTLKGKVSAPQTVRLARHQYV